MWLTLPRIKNACLGKDDGTGRFLFLFSGPGRPNELQGQSRCSVLRRVPKTTRGWTFQPKKTHGRSTGNWNCNLVTDGLFGCFGDEAFNIRHSLIFQEWFKQHTVKIETTRWFCFNPPILGKMNPKLIIFIVWGGFVNLSVGDVRSCPSRIHHHERSLFWGDYVWFT